MKIPNQLETNMITDSSLTRRRFLSRSAASVAAAAVPGFIRSAEALASPEQTSPKGSAEHCIFVWLGGGQSHIDTWDPKRKGDPKAKKPGAYYDAIDTAIPGVRVCEHLRRCAPILDRFALLRTVHHEVIDEHAAATNRVHTGRPTSGTIVYPSVGSVVAHQRGPASDTAPAYVVIGYPNVTRGPGFLGAQAGYVYLTDTEAGPSGLARPADVTAARQQRHEQLLGQMREDYLNRHRKEVTLADYDAALAESLRLAGPDFMSVFQLDREQASLREGYGGEFGQRCLLARRLVQSGVRFVEVSHNLNFLNGAGWDIHNEGHLKQHLLIEEMDQALWALVLDLERQKLLDKTLVVVATEFGRPPGFDGKGGRGHYSKAFSIILAGGGLRTGQAVGETDELGTKILSQPVSIPDLHATIYATLGINPAEELYAPGDRPVPITDQGHAIAQLFG